MLIDEEYSSFKYLDILNNLKINLYFFEKK